MASNGAALGDKGLAGQRSAAKPLTRDEARRIAARGTHAALRINVTALVVRVVGPTMVMAGVTIVAIAVVAIVASNDHYRGVGPVSPVVGLRAAEAASAAPPLLPKNVGTVEE